jgi:hypothetical protein
MGKYNTDRPHSFTNGFAVPYIHLENSHSKTRKLKFDRFSSFIEVDEIEVRSQKKNTRSQSF